jgi:hypothetical protein
MVDPAAGNPGAGESDPPGDAQQFPYNISFLHGYLIYNLFVFAWFSNSDRIRGAVDKRMHMRTCFNFIRVFI